SSAADPQRMSCAMAGVARVACRLPAGCVTVLWCSNAVGNPEIICICFFSARLPCQPCRAPHFTLEPLFRLPGATRLHSSALPTGEPFCRMVPGPSADQRIPHGASTATLVEL
ncbi:unnamed protein product, partial [Prorocentrum cordatum]